MDDLSASLRASPELFPFAFEAERDRVHFLRLSRADYASASFLDERILAASPRAQRAIGWSDVVAATSAMPERLDYIFHIGHVGSTLLSRLLGSDPRILPLREPAILRILALLRAQAAAPPARWTEDDFTRRLSGFLKLWSRTFAEDERVILKATSFASVLAPELLLRDNHSRAVLMYAAPESYLASILGAPNSPMEAKALAPMRLGRLERTVGQSLPPISSMSAGEVVAMSWASEMTSLLRARQAAADRAMLLDFDAFLASPRDLLAVCFRHFDFDVSEEALGAIVGGPLMRQYSKAPEHAYDADLRRAVQDDGRRLFAPEIRHGLAWLERMGKEHSGIAVALETRTRPSAIDAGAPVNARKPTSYYGNRRKP